MIRDKMSSLLFCAVSLWVNCWPLPMVTESSPYPEAKVTVFVGFNPALFLIHVSYSRIHCLPSTSSINLIIKKFSSAREVCPELSRLSLLPPNQVSFNCLQFPSFEILLFIVVADSENRNPHGWSWSAVSCGGNDWWRRISKISSLAFSLYGLRWRAVRSAGRTSEVYVIIL